MPLPICSRLNSQTLSSIFIVVLAIVSCTSLNGLAIAGDFYIEGYTDHVSYRSPETINLHVSTSAPQFSVDIARVGKSREVIYSKTGVPGKQCVVPENASSHGCNWPVALSIPIESQWKSGYFEIVLRIQDNGEKFQQRGKRTAESTCFFVLRSSVPAENTSVLLQLSTNTYNAYNNWGGFSLYAYNGLALTQGHRVSFHRPPASQYYNWEQPFVAWCESNNITIDYAANSDLELFPDEIKKYSLVLSVGHDEYWSKPMRDNLESYITNGGNVAFFSGNTCCWQVRVEEYDKALVCWKQRLVMDPVYATDNLSTLSTLWSHHLVKRPENQLTGVGFLWGGYHRSHGQLMDGSGAYTVHRPTHWIFEGTDLKANELLGANDTIVGYECDGCEIEWRDGLPFPTHRDGTPEGFEILATAPAVWHPDDAYFYDRFEKGRQGASVLGTYVRGGTVVTVGSTDWAHGLRGKDKSVEMITRNILKRLSKPIAN